MITPSETKVNVDRSIPCLSRSLPTHGNENLSQSINHHNQKAAKTTQVKKQFSDNDDILFDMEGYHNEKNCEPFFESDDESSGK